MKPVWLSEIEPFPIAVTAKHHPEVQNLGSVTDIKGDEIEPVDIITSGSPCQDMSCAGKQSGMVDGQGNKTRSGLFYDGMKIFNDMREKTNGQFPRFFVWENVCFSSDTLVLTENGYHPISFVNEGDHVLTLSGRFFPVRKIHRTENQKVLSMQVGDSEPIKVTKNHPIYVREYDEGLWPIEIKTVEEIQNSDKTYYAGYPVGQITYDSFGISREMFDAKQFGKCIARLYLASERENYNAFPSFLYFLDTDIAKDIMDGVSYIINTSVIQTRFKETAFFFANLIRNMLARTGRSPCVRKGKGSNWEVVEDSHPSIYQDDYVWLPITKIEDKGEITNVYNLSVEDDNSYTADGIVAHNCGSFSSRKGLDFKSVLEEVAGTEIPMPRSGKWANAGMVRSDRCDIAWRVLDSQFFRVAQRRRRVFLIADFTTGPRCAGQILFEQEGRAGDSQKSGVQGKGTSPETQGGTRASGGNCLTPWDVQSKRIFDESKKFCSLQATENNGEKPGNIFVESQTLNPWDSQANKITSSNGIMPTIRSGNGYPNSNILVEPNAAGFIPNNSEKARSLGYRDEQAPTLSGMDSGNKPSVVIYKESGTASEKDSSEFFMPKVSIRQNGKIIGTIESSVKPVQEEKQEEKEKITAIAIDSLSSNSMKSSNPHSGFHKTEISKTLDTTNPDPSKNQGGMMIFHETEEPRKFPVYRSFCKKREETYAVLQNTRNELYLSDKMYSITCGGGKPGQGYPCIWTRKANEEENFSVYDMTHADEVMRKVKDGKSQTLNARMGTGGNQVPVIAYSFAGNIIGRKNENGGHQMGIDKNISFTLNTVDRHAVCATDDGNETFRDKADCLTSAYGTKWNGNASADNGSLFAKSGKSVRRLTPLECERLQGLPDSYTLIDDKTCSDTSRYKALGNGMAQPVADWLFKRIKEIAYPDK